MQLARLQGFDQATSLLIELACSRHHDVGRLDQFGGLGGRYRPRPWRRGGVGLELAGFSDVDRLLASLELGRRVDRFELGLELVLRTGSVAPHGDL